MTKADFVSAVAEKAGVSKKDVEAVIGAGKDVVIDAVKAGDKVGIPGFGTFSRKDSAAREGINPLTKQKIKIAAKKGLKFTPAAANKDL